MVVLNIAESPEPKTNWAEDQELTKEHSSEKDYSQDSVVDIVRTRSPWLFAFCVGLLMAAMVVEGFENLLERHVALSFFVPLIMGHGGNTGSQSVSTVIRALALKQVGRKDALAVALKEAMAGGVIGVFLGLCVLAFSCVWPGLSADVGTVVAVSLPIVSLWANFVGAGFTMIAGWCGLDPAITAVPLMTTVVDSTGLVIYFYLAKCIMDLEHGTVVSRAHHGLLATMYEQTQHL